MSATSGGTGGGLDWGAVRTLAELRALTTQLPPPVVVFNKSHSGSRLLARLLAEAGIAMGAVRNKSEDALPLVALVEHCVATSYPDFTQLFGDPEVGNPVARVAAEAFAKHLAGHTGGPWGWKLCETGHILPLVHHLFPGARYIHLIRDGRDVAFANHVPPHSDFWQKIYVNATTVGRWNGLFFGRHSRGTYRLYPHLYNIQHWVNSVTVGRRFGAMLGPAYLETRYERLCTAFETEALRVLRFAGAPYPEAAIAKLVAGVRSDRIGRFRAEPFWRVRQVVRRGRPLLAELGYLD